MAVDTINSNALTDSTVVAADIADSTITSAKLAGSIANAKLANNSITVNGQTIALGASGAIPDVQWQSVVVSDGSTVTTMVAGRGYFVNNASAAGIVKLPASASAGDTIRIKDYAGNFGTNNLTIQRNGHNIQGAATNSEISTDRTAIALVYADATKGWLYSVLSTPGNFGKLYHSATGGTVTTSGDFKIHSFTGSSNFVVSSVGNAAGSGTKVSYTVVAGGAGGGGRHGGGGGAGGFREGRAPNDSYAVSPLNAPDGLPISATTYPITVGAGGTGISGSPYEATATNGTNSVFSTITSTGGGHGGGYPSNSAEAGGSGGGGGGNLQSTSNGGSGNTPPVSPPQGNNGGSGASGGCSGAGGGGATAASSNTPVSGAGTAGGAGAENSITGSPVTRSGGGGGCPTGPPVPGGGTVAGGAGGGGYGVGNNSQAAQSGTANTGGGGGGNRSPGGTCGSSGGGGSGIVIIRYKYQN
tara:strand:+ start:154 stop:1569 length:1416 start_codon:yes stop_codon:yes gene_type:complete